MGRFHGLDACRAAAMLLGLFFHGAISFMSTPIGWAIRDRSTHQGVDAFVWICHTFRMPVFFLLAGFFGRLLYLKLGPAEFFRHRARRLLIPFVVTLVPLLPSLYFLWKWGYAKAGPQATHPLGIQVPSLELADLTPSPGHLWFLYYLMIIVAGFGVVLLLASRLPTDGVSRGLDGLLRGLVRFRLVALFMALPTAGTLYFMKSLEVETPVSFVPQPRILAFYAVFYGFGWLLHRQKELVVELGKKLWIPAILAAAILVPLGLLVERAMNTGGAMPPLWNRVGALYLSALFGWSLVLLFMGAFIRWGEQPRPWVSYLSDASYWCYLVHLPVVIAFQILVSDLPLPGLLKYAMVMTATIAVCLASYHTLARYTFIGAALNGKRERPAAPAPVTP